MFGSVLRRLRVAAGLNVKQLADAAGIQRSNLSAMEHGRLKPTVANIEVLATVLHVPDDSTSRIELFTSAELLPPELMHIMLRRKEIVQMVAVVYHRGLSSKDVFRMIESASV